MTEQLEHLIRLLRTWPGWALVPFFAFMGVFLVAPAISIFTATFGLGGPHPTLATITQLWQSVYQQANLATFELSFVSSLTSTVAGLLIVWAVIELRSVGWLRNTLTTFCAVTANFAGIPLAFAFVATLGVQGVFTQFLLTYLHLNIYSLGFSLTNLIGLGVVYSYFQIPLATILTLPVVDHIKAEWREAASSLGSTSLRYWLRVGIPIVAPVAIGNSALLFANAFTAYATPYALVAGVIPLLPLEAGAFLSGNVSTNVNMGQALALDMMVVLSLTFIIFVRSQRRMAQWLS